MRYSGKSIIRTKMYLGWTSLVFLVGFVCWVKWMVRLRESFSSLSITALDTVGEALRESESLVYRPVVVTLRCGERTRSRNGGKRL
ncbi:Uncharacterised protein [Nocardiopsis dassonvillei]|uniref:Uncharacterized protein n=1 Tax=Nocardiopsis dassonvillei (strain ATCC 23218 / DSM 43111 / CIP 107115 / JCM 7437 / KCTC 9190 / NBRC 14626 / NCTC 10488 / NRRL B-5397 / IMRU 509) TaxID=446468 RepID=D7AYX2_NOCDD|nr:hypothetical protein Ndas_2720 [Nocardiopsis dassonvillei subsp. dassonvillei DSM 43111]VEI88635.1 Uncharacterised protein [Nocardiopsis dassonvillei]